jgi:hypothetical protein
MKSIHNAKVQSIDVEHLQLFNVKIPKEKVKQKRILSFHEVLGPILTGLI